MAKAKKRARRTPKQQKASKLSFHAFWSGSIAFGLVSVPVHLFPASRHGGVRLRMMSPEGSLLERRFYCPRHGKEVPSAELVRGYELDDGSYIIVGDELEAIEPRKTRKRNAGRDLIHTDHEASSQDSDREGGVDLLETIRQSLRQPAKGRAGTAAGMQPSPNGSRGKQKEKATR